MLAGHELLNIQHAVERHDAYVVVEKVGQQGEVAERMDPRQDGDPN
ncbi:MAG TPA: hypothetical protein VLK59_06595 [Solirubrobacteraceae bacterium]|nr:hypothetical protein [Solirubrobacteraceae bacterium]